MKLKCKLFEPSYTALLCRSVLSSLHGPQKRRARCSEPRPHQPPGPAHLRGNITTVCPSGSGGSNPNEDQLENNSNQRRVSGLPDDDVDWNMVAPVGTWVSWLGLVGYAFYLAPNQTPLRDLYLLEFVTGFGSDDTYTLNTIFASLFALSRVFPPIYAALMIPSSRNGNWLPAWPFLFSSMVFGSFALLPYFAMWEPSSDPNKVPPAPRDMDVGLRITESPWFAAALLGLSGLFLFQFFSAGGDEWYQFGKLFEESRLVHMTTVDVITLMLALPFWLYNDASARGFKQQKLLPLFVALPGVGPAIYLFLRPRGQDLPPEEQT